MNGRVSIQRWGAKKGARLAVAALGATRLHRSRAGDSARVRVLTYHRFGDARRDPFCVSVNAFERHMAWLSSHRLAVSLADVHEVLAGRGELADGSVLVTIDDGCPSVLSRALPVLQRHRIPAVAFVPAGEIGEDDAGARSDDGDTEARLTWSELSALADAGVTVGSHAWTHRSLGGMSLSDVREQSERSRGTLEQRLGRAVTAFAYPFGTRADFNESTAAILRDSGYTCAFTAQHGAVRRGMDPFTLPRVKVEGGEPFWMFRLLCRGALDGWRRIDETLWRLQARRDARLPELHGQRVTP